MSMNKCEWIWINLKNLLPSDLKKVCADIINMPPLFLSSPHLIYYNHKKDKFQEDDIPYDIYNNNFSHQMIIPIIFISPAWIFRQNRSMFFIMKRKYYRLQSLPTIGNFYKLKLNCKIKNYDLALLIDGM